MSHIHVCLVSEQTIPNILGLYHFQPPKIVFCTSGKMENLGKSDAIINTLKLYDLDYSNKFDRVLVDQDCLEDCEARLSNIAQKYSNHKFVVNLTGGTKIMVLGAYNVFKSIENTQMIYTPIPKNEFIEVFPRKGDCGPPIPLNLRLSVDAYVTAYGIRTGNRDKIEQLKSNAIRNKETSEWMINNYVAIEDLLSSFIKEGLNERRGDKKNYRFKMDCSNLRPKERELLLGLRFEIGRDSIERMLTKYEIRFLTGDWLSDFCFNEVSKLSIDDCVTGIELISSKGTNNEFDVLFTKDNALYIVECKSLKQEHDKDADILYKISALQHDFGLKVDGFLVSTSRTILNNKGDIKEHILRRSDQCKTKVVHPNEIKNIGPWIKKHIKGL